MMSLSEITRINNKRAVIAARENLQPLEYTGGGMKELRMIPNISSYRPEGFRLVRKLFVENWGLGKPGEHGLTTNEFAQEAIEGRYYAIIEEGRFQVCVGEFTRKIADNAVTTAKIANDAVTNVDYAGEDE